ncbi:MAG: M15 family metallopeptidase [Bacteroidota bacterium]
MTSSSTILDTLIRKGTLSEVLHLGATPGEEIKEFKQLLFELGFSGVQDAATRQITGSYDSHTAQAVRIFCLRNHLQGDGTEVDTTIAKCINHRYASLSALLQLQSDLDKGLIAQKYYRGSPDTKAVSALQTLLADLGLGNLMGLDQNDTHGIYGDGTVAAVEAYMRRKKIDPSSPTDKKPTDDKDTSGSDGDGESGQGEDPSSTDKDKQGDTGDRPNENKDTADGDGESEQGEDPSSADKDKKEDAEDDNPAAGDGDAEAEQEEDPSISGSNKKEDGDGNEAAAQGEESSMATSDAAKDAKASEDQELPDPHGLLAYSGHALEQLVKKGIASHVLQQGGKASLAIKKLKTTMHLLGFGKELGKGIGQLDGHYDSGLVKAVKSFAQKNGIAGDGKQVGQNLAQQIVSRLNALPFLHQMRRDLGLGKIESNYQKGSTHKLAVGALQYLLNGLGLGKELNWSQKSNDGKFDQHVVKALKSYFNKNYFQKANQLTPNMANTIVQNTAKKYGDAWEEHVKYPKGSDQSVLVEYSNANFTGKPITTHTGFVPQLQKINSYAGKHNVKVWITSSYRPDTDVDGSIVPPSQMSNHMVGHAIDMNVQYYDGQGNLQLANSKMLSKDNQANWPASVKGFLTDIINDPDLRWGGDFSSDPDPVHIDDHYNKDPDAW